MSKKYINRFVRQAKKELAARDGPISGELLFNIITGSTAGCREFPLFQRAMKYEPKIANEVVFRDLDNNVYTNFWIKGKKYEDAIDELYVRYEGGERIEDIVQYAQDELRVSTTVKTLRNIFRRAEHYSELKDATREVIELIYGAPIGVLRESQLYTKGKDIEGKGRSNELEQIVKVMAEGPENFVVVNHASSRRNNVGQNTERSRRVKALVPIAKLRSIVGKCIHLSDLYRWTGYSDHVQLDTFEKYISAAKKLARRMK